MEQSQVQKLAWVQKLGFRNKNQGFRNKEGSETTVQKLVLSSSETGLVGFSNSFFRVQKLCSSVSETISAGSDPMECACGSCLLWWPFLAYLVNIYGGEGCCSAHFVYAVLEIWESILSAPLVAVGRLPHACIRQFSVCGGCS